MLNYQVVPVTAADYRRLAEKRLPRFLFDYIDGAAGEELSMSRNVEAFRAVQLRQRVMRDVSDIRTETTLSGQAAAMPVVLGPVALAGMYRRRGEAQAYGTRARRTYGMNDFFYGLLALAGGTSRRPMATGTWSRATGPPIPPMLPIPRSRCTPGSSTMPGRCISPAPLAVT